ncbi:hypothetical protein [Neorhizobium alkalisoli]|uniref:Uncharacterized protein n=1 Tax=Neorhizobium alkalisoli TaxID=528178 RepID=A0A561PSS7_9HYPH|nr:hypothetical protein [Neorhizobium alkalisoli]TWF41184.1 hypothetical protein FHW37_1273 [Neorhizobium alkalisoli]
MHAKDTTDYINGALTKGTVIHQFASSHDFRGATLKQVTFEAGKNKLSVLIKTETNLITLTYREAFVQNFPLMNKALRQDGPKLLHHDFDIICGKLQHAFVFEHDEFSIAFSSFDFAARPRLPK